MNRPIRNTEVATLRRVVAGLLATTTQAELAKRLGLPRVAITNAYNGHGTVTTARALEETFGITIIDDRPPDLLTTTDMQRAGVSHNVYTRAITIGSLQAKSTQPIRVERAEFERWQASRRRK